MESASRYLLEPSAYSTPSASEDLPEPETPAIPTISFSGMSTSILLRLCTRAPRICMYSGMCFIANGSVFHSILLQILYHFLSVNSRVESNSVLQIKNVCTFIGNVCFIGNKFRGYGQSKNVA